MTQFKSDSAILDITTGRAALEKIISTAPVQVTITGIIRRPWGQDDGTSTEFHVEVGDLTVTLPTPQS